MRNLVTSLTAKDRLQAASEFLRLSAGQEVLLVSPTRAPADELLRDICIQTGSIFGVHRFTVPQLAIEAATTRLVEAGKTVLEGVAVDALAARAVSSCRNENELDWFEPVAKTPGFFRALASTITELRLNDVDLKRLKESGPAGHDLANLLRRYNPHLEETRLADLAAVFDAAKKAVQSGEWSFKKDVILFLDITPTTHLEQEFLNAVATQAASVLATAHSRDEDSIEIWSRILNTKPSVISESGTQTALEKLRTYVFRTETPPKGDLDASVGFISATDESRECVEIARSILAAADSGLPFDHIAVLLRNPELYQPLLEDSLRRGGISAFYTRGTKRPNPAGRALLALLACASEKLSATRFSEYLSLGQMPAVENQTQPLSEPTWQPPQGELFAGIAPQEEPAPTDDSPPNLESPVAAGTLRAPRQWERLLVDAAVIGGHDRWVRRLTGLRKELQKRLLELSGDDEASQQRLERELLRLENLQKFASRQT